MTAAQQLTLEKIGHHTMVVQARERLTLGVMQGLPVELGMLNGHRGLIGEHRQEPLLVAAEVVWQAPLQIQGAQYLVPGL